MSAADLATFEAEIVGWLVEAGLEGCDLGEVLGDFAERLRAGDVPVTRATIGSDLLHPVIDARGYRWEAGKDTERQEFTREDWPNMEEKWRKSPLFRLIESGSGELRRRLDAGYARGEFPILDDLQDAGFTDYVACKVEFGQAMTLGEQSGVIGTFATDRPAGFSARDIGLLCRLMRPLALTFRAVDAVLTTRVLMETYLGTDPARQVLAGAIERGVAEPVNAVLWFSDLVGFTKIADSAPRNELMQLLDDYADGLVTVIRRHGGEVLKFMGDGILAKFPHDLDGRACGKALDAAAAALRKTDLILARRTEAGLPVSDVRIALHVGEVLYGNVGSADRLDFTVVGPAVNELSRIQGLCRSLEQRVVISSAFAEIAGEARARLVSLGRYALRGVRRPDELFTLDADALADGGAVPA